MACPSGCLNGGAQLRNIIQAQTDMPPADLPWDHSWTPVYWQLQTPLYGELPLQVERAQYHMRTQARIRVYYQV